MTKPRARVAKMHKIDTVVSKKRGTNKRRAKVIIPIFGIGKLVGVRKSKKR